LESTSFLHSAAGLIFVSETLWANATKLANSFGSDVS
jgi:hypothetical protein